MSTHSNADTKITGGLKIANSFRPYYVFPCSGFTSVPKALLDYATAPHDDKKLDKASGVNEDEPQSHVWLVQNLKFGTTWAATPTFVSNLRPSRIHLSIPDQIKWPSAFLGRLDAKDSVHIHGARSRDLGIAAYLRKGLAHWSANLDGFEKKYADLPPGSTIVLNDMREDPTDLEFKMDPNTPDADCSPFLSATELAGLWGYEESEMPPTIPYTSLRLDSYLESDVMLVFLEGKDRSTDFLAFKTRNDPLTIYHELKILLQLPSHKTIIPPPGYLVTFKSGSGQPLVCGFLTPYLEGGSLDVRLPEFRRAGLLSPEYQLHFAKSITSTLILISASPAEFYSDLRLDQIVLSKDETGRYTPVFLDFEQSRNLYNWASPEIYYMEWIAELGSPHYFRSKAIPEDVTKKYAGVLDCVLEARRYTLTAHPQRYDNPPQGWYWPWLISTPEERESAMVYMVGKLLWCLFEGRGDADIVMGRSSPEEGDQRFPNFERTPPRMRRLIERCTAGAREWIDGPIKIYRRGGVIYPLGKTGQGKEPEATAGETLQAIGEFWQDEMRKAVEFAEARVRWDRKEEMEGDRELLHYLERPRLCEVLAELEAFDKEGRGGP
ncbi:hypothetical protein B0T11DRAFT_340136 [Plectosphaerella cucumerina]|uniref:Protein kinase domain-containing protein n=1 Tax=Plectosphaerella cucumerina TaxID=40658 RepID=A0A8K0X4D0_9PEZI|nr:hypothetical protein B0T11DRAFT_340136 [Plectosphaerella cucumerina]